MRNVVIYARYRTGGVGIDSANQAKFLACLSEENKHCPGLSSDWLRGRPGALEVFILDRGIGMISAFESGGQQIVARSGKAKNKFFTVMNNTFVLGMSAKKERQTQYGGLHLLNNILEETTDYVRAIEGDVWFGSSVPFKEGRKNPILTSNRATRKGLALHLRLGWKSQTDRGKNWAEFSQENDYKLWWEELAFSEQDCEKSFDWFRNQSIIDERFDHEAPVVIKGDGDWILWFVHPHRMKWDILSFLEKKVSPLATTHAKLAIVDIPSYEAGTYAEALSGFKFMGTQAWPKYFEYIILGTDQFRFSALQSKEYPHSKWGFSELHEEFSSLKISPPPISPKPKNLRLALVRWMKWHDSRRLWDEVASHKDMFIPKRIVWNEDVIISGYLDFEKTTHNHLCSDIYRQALSRVFGVLPSNLRMQPIDQLSSLVLREMCASEMYEYLPYKKDHEAEIALGSVLVSGSTLAAAVSEQVRNLHLFIHGDSGYRGKRSALLYWLPNTQSDVSSVELHRIGNTSTVAPEGWKSFEIPRFDKFGKSIGYKTPEDTYSDWQNLDPVFVKAGHWNYEGHHDFITINISKAVEASFLAKNKLGLAGFLVGKIFQFIGVKKEDIKPEWHKFAETAFAEVGNSNAKKSDSNNNYGILIYRSHVCSELIIKKLLKILTKDGEKKALSRIISVLRLRRRCSGSTMLIPPLLREDIKTKISFQSAPDPRPVMIFDDAAITGRTLQDLRTTLFDLGAKKVQTLVVVNRLRQPAGGIRSEQFDYYWRLDVPVMGREGNCPFCHAIQLSSSFVALLSSNHAKEQIMKWVEIWRGVSPLDNWSGGLRPMLLSLPDKKDYCYRSSNDEVAGQYLAQIDLTRSTGVIIHVTELHAMTNRDDYCIKRIADFTEPEPRIEIAASQLYIFGDEFEYDIRLRLLEILIRELGRLPNDSSHAPLALFAIIGGLELLSDAAKQLASNVVINEKWANKEKQQYAAKILLAYLTSKSLLDNGSEEYSLGKRLLSPVAWSLAQRLNAWFREALSPEGNAHSEAIPLLINRLRESADIRPADAIDALNSLDHIENIVNSMEKVLIRKVKDEISKFEKNVADMKVCATKVRRQIDSFGEDPEQWRMNMHKELSAYLYAMKAAAKAYFHQIFVLEHRNVDSFERIILPALYENINWRSVSGKHDLEVTDRPSDTRTVSVSFTGKRDFDKFANEVWIVWDNEVSHIVLDLIKNAFYANKQILDPWDKNNPVTAHMWIKVDYFSKWVEITLVNNCNDDPESIFLKMKKERWSFLEDLGGHIKYATPSELPGLLGIIVNIPYAGYLGRINGDYK